MTSLRLATLVGMLSCASLLSCASRQPVPRDDASNELRHLESKTLATVNAVVGEVFIRRFHRTVHSPAKVGDTLRHGDTLWVKAGQVLYSNEDGVTRYVPEGGFTDFVVAELQARERAAR